MLYLIKEYGKEKEYLKIGKADSIDNRIKQYDTHCAEFEVLDTFEGNTKEEKLLHTLLEDYTVKGEWMEYSEEILSLWKMYKHLYPIIKKSVPPQIKEVYPPDYKTLKESIAHFADINERAITQAERAITQAEESAIHAKCAIKLVEIYSSIVKSCIELMSPEQLEELEETIPQEQIGLLKESLSNK